MSFLGSKVSNGSPKSKPFPWSTKPPTLHLTSLMGSPTIFPLLTAPSSHTGFFAIPGTCQAHSTLRPFHWLCLLSETLLPQIVTRSTSHYFQSLCFHITFWPPYWKLATSAQHSWFAPYMVNLFPFIALTTFSHAIKIAVMFILFCCLCSQEWDYLLIYPKL